MKKECVENLTQENLKKFDEWVENIRKKIEQYYLLGVSVKMDFEDASAQAVDPMGFERMPTGRVYLDLELELFDKSKFYSL